MSEDTDTGLRDVQRRRLALHDQHLEIALLDWGGDGPLCLLHHANGFCGALWAPVAEKLREHFHVVAMDARGHGDSSLPPEGVGAEAFAWGTLAQDLAGVAHAILSETGESHIALGLGHSFGGTLMLAAAAAHPGLFERILLLDPVIMPAMSEDEARAHAQDVGLAERSRRRQHEWSGREEAHAFFSSKQLFQSWQPRSIDLYVAEGLRERADGRVELKCPGAVEAMIFDGAHTMDIFSRVSGLETPVHIRWAAKGNFPKGIYQQLAAEMRRAEIQDVDGGHLFPMEEPDLVVEMVERICL